MHSAFQKDMNILVQQQSSLTGQRSVRETCSRPTSPLIQMTFHVQFYLSCQTFTMSASLRRGIRLLRWLGPPVRTLACSRPPLAVKRRGRSPVPISMTSQRPVAACYTPAEVWHTGLTIQGQSPRSAYLLVQVSQPLTPVYSHDASTQVSGVSIGRRAGRTTALWLAEAELLSAGFAPHRVPLGDARCVALMSVCKHRFFKKQSCVSLKGAP